VNDYDQQLDLFLDEWFDGPQRAERLDYVIRCPHTGVRVFTLTGAKMAAYMMDIAERKGLDVALHRDLLLQLQAEATIRQAEAQFKMPMPPPPSGPKQPPN
jgi:hypothetical protein